ncbi:MAG TPA: histidine triad nucleotide-binding protein [Pyrinomonadaceae bacterium]|nr:histidine triad nucleotide-binding protein [Pyrinomonadaceae bacterium]
MTDSNCIFCRIISGAIPSDRVFEDELCIAFNDITPQAPHHVLVIPREHVASLDAAESRHRELLGHLLLKGGEIARDKGFAQDGYRLVINTNSDGGQTVFHLHVHLMGGRQFIFPPG